MAKAPAKQVAALPWRKRRGKIEILLITSRATKRWVIPKGWPIPGLKDYNAARLEAFEEAGLEGRLARTAIGAFSYNKALKGGATRRLRVDVFAMQVKTICRNWPEKSERKRKWFALDEARLAVVEPRLRAIIAKLG